MQRYLIVNADDFGLSVGVNEGIVRAHQEGIVTSASLMVRGPAAEHAVQSCGDLDLGLHIDLGEWAYRDGQWMVLYERAPAEDGAVVHREIHEQLAVFERLTGTLPTHLDSHQHVHWHNPAREVATLLAQQLGIPLRGLASGIRYCGSFYGQTEKGASCAEAISVESLINLLASLTYGVTELGCHPGDDAELESEYRLERACEVATLCDSRVRHALEEKGIQLFGFTDINISNTPDNRADAHGDMLASDRGK